MIELILAQNLSLYSKDLRENADKIYFICLFIRIY